MDKLTQKIWDKHCRISEGYFDKDMLKDLDPLQARREKQRRSWQLCWGWEGPKPGEPLQVNSLCAQELDGEMSFWYCAPCIAEKEIEPDKWIVRVEYPETAAEWLRERNGTKLILDVADIWPLV